MRAPPGALTTNRVIMAPRGSSLPWIRTIGNGFITVGAAAVLPAFFVGSLWLSFGIWRAFVRAVRTARLA